MINELDFSQKKIEDRRRKIFTRKNVEGATTLAILLRTTEILWTDRIRYFFTNGYYLSMPTNDEYLFFLITFPRLVKYKSTALELRKYSFIHKSKSFLYKNLKASIDLEL